MKTQGELSVIKKAIEDQGIKQKWIAGKLSVSEPTITLFLKGERSMSQAKINTLTKLLGV
jgi:predicted XRE-type DNA-binding protein